MTRVSGVMSTQVVCVGPQDTVLDAINRMMDAGVGSVAVCDGPHLVGILTERDVLRLASAGERFDQIQVGDVMTQRPVTIDPFTSIVEAAHLMGERGVRHLPVVEGDYIHGMVGIRDVLRTLVERAWREHDDDARETAQELLRRR
jgi:CBS domain-containing protein